MKNVGKCQSCMDFNYGLSSGRRWILLTFPGQQTESLAAQGQSLTHPCISCIARARGPAEICLCFAMVCCRAGRLIVGARGRPNHVTDAFQLSSSYAKVPMSCASSPMQLARFSSALRIPCVLRRMDALVQFARQRRGLALRQRTKNTLIWWLPLPGIQSACRACCARCDGPLLSSA